jgi:hypothetical protein
MLMPYLNKLHDFWKAITVTTLNFPSHSQQFDLLCNTILNNKNIIIIIIIIIELNK